MDLTPALIAIAVPLAIGWMTRAAKPDAALVAGRRIATYSKPFKAFAIGTCVLAASPLVVIPFRPAEEALPLLAIAGIFALPGGLLLAYALRMYIAWSDAGIEWRTPWRPARSVPWSDIRSVTDVRARGWYAIETAGSGKIKAYTMMSGVPALIDELKGRGLRVR